MPGIYSYDSPKKLFKKRMRDYTSFCLNPSEDGLFNKIFPLYHLREWICPGKNVHKKIQSKSKIDYTREEELYVTLHHMREYKVIRSLCNNAKHFEYKPDDLNGRMDVLYGARVDLMQAGDLLSITHFTVDSIEVRTIFGPVYMAYYKYFNNQLSD
jgi:hypothetical protein